MSVVNGQSNDMQFVAEGSSEMPGLVAEVQSIYVALNNELFEGLLPPCNVVLRRHRRNFGTITFSRHGVPYAVPELSINSAYVGCRTIRSTMAMIAAFMCEVDVRRSCGKTFTHRHKMIVSRLQSIGLISSSTGLPNGAKGGRHTGIYILTGGPFDEAFARLMRQGQSWITWLDAYAFGRPPNGYDQIDILTFSVDGDQDPRDRHLKERSKELGVPPALVDRKHEKVCLPVGERNPRAKHLYVCPGCKARLWGKPGLGRKAFCAACNLDYIETS